MRAKKEMAFGLFRMKADMTLAEFYELFVEHRRILTVRRTKSQVLSARPKTFY